VQGIVLCVARPQARNQVFNLTYGGARSLNQMTEIMREQFRGIKVNYQPRDKLMPERGTLSVEKAKRLLGYAPPFRSRKVSCATSNGTKALRESTRSSSACARLIEEPPSDEAVWKRSGTRRSRWSRRSASITKAASMRRVG
jgi:hypothetical protein